MICDPRSNSPIRFLLAFVLVLSAFVFVENANADEPLSKLAVPVEEESGQVEVDAKKEESDEPNSGETSTEESGLSKLADIELATEVVSQARIPVTLPDGRPLVPIMMYQSQMDELIPNTFRPVSIDRLSQAVQKMTDRATDDQASRLKGAVYWVRVVGDELVSENSVIDIESDLRSVVRRSLGKVNLAIAPSLSRGPFALQSLPRLETESDGNLVAVFQGDSRLGNGIEFQWSLRGETREFGTDFQLQLPRTPQTRIMISAPREVTVEALDGVLRKHLAPPPDARLSDASLSWFEVDAGGLSEVRLRVRKAQQKEQSFVVRRTSVDYEASPSGLSWNCEMVVQLPPDGTFPPLAIRGATITSLQVDGTQAQYRTEIIGGRESRLQIDSLNNEKNESVAKVVTVAGQSTWTSRNGWCDLPMPTWIGSQVIHGSPVDDVQLAVVQPVEMLEWQLPSDWKQSPTQKLDGENVYLADGPPIARKQPRISSADGTGANQESSTSERNRLWSRVRFVGVPVVTSADVALKLEVEAGTLNAQTRMNVQLSHEQIEPLRLVVEPRWTVTSLTFPKSGRVIESLNVNEKSRVIVLWPDVEDIGEGEIVLEITGTKLLPNAPSELTIPPSWFARIDGVRGEMVAAIVPREDLKWSGEAAMHEGLIKRSQLNEEQQQFFAGMNEDTLWYRPANGHTPRVLLQTPSVSFNTSTEFHITRDRDEVVEQLEVEFDIPGQSLRNVVVQTGPREGRPPLLWSISGDDVPSISLSTAAVILGTGEEEGVYKIDVADQNMRGKRLVGRRRYPVPDQATLRLPTISGAASQNARALIGAGLQVTKKSRSVQLVPPKLPTELSISNQSTTSEPTIGSHRIRYDAAEQPLITFARSDVSPSVTIVWREQVRVIASSRGTDRIEANYRVSPTEPLEIEYDPGLQLASVSRDGLPVDLITIQQRPSIVLQPRAKTETIHVVWNRSQYETGWIRECRIPRIKVSGTVLKSEYQLISAADAFAPAALLQSGKDGHGAVNLRAGDNSTLIRRNIALAIGWMVALVMFSVSWTFARRSPMLLVALLVMLSTMLVLWWPWRLAVIGWLIVPVVAAGLLATSRAWSEMGSRFSDSDKLPHGQETHSKNDSVGDFSFETFAKMMLWLIFAVGVAEVFCESVVGQEFDRPQASVAILVPVDDEGALAGNMIYVPGSVHADLFRTTVSVKPQNARFQTANYRVNIDPTLLDTEDSSQAVVEAEFLIHVEDQGNINNLVRLPLSPAAVRRIELLGEVNRIIQFKEDTESDVIAVLPPGGDYRIRVTLMPMVQQDDPWTKLTLAIPQVCSSRLAVETDQTIDALAVGGEQGHLLEETELRRWVKDLGPVETLDLRYRTVARANSAIAQPLERRYWINAGKRHVVIDCEVEPPSAIAAGETFQFVVRDAEMPTIVSPNWKLESSENFSLTRRSLLTFKCTTDSPGPVQLLWTQPAAINRADEINPVPIRIPEVLAAALGENAPAWIALYSDSALQFAPLVGDNTERMTVGYFIDQWSGFRGRIDHVYRVIEGLPLPILQAQSAIEPNVRQRHHLYVKSDRLELQYTAVLSPSDHPINRLTLNVPADVELIHVSADGKEVHGEAIRSGDSNEVLLGEIESSESVTIKAVGIRSLPENMRFSPPRFSLNLKSSSGLYSMSRDRSTELRVVDPPALKNSPPQASVSEDSLSRGWLPVASWMVEDSEGLASEHSLGGVFEVKPRPIRFDCRQLIALSRDNEGWAMETLVAFRSNRSRPNDQRVPDYIDVEIPTRWCGALEISPESELTQRVAADEAFRIVRIRCDEEQLQRGVLSIRGRLQDEDAGRVNVPSVRVLGLGQRQVRISVPDRVLNDSIQWRTSAVEAAKPSLAWTETEYVSEMRSLYSVANPSWSVDLAPLPDIDADAYVGAMDTQVFEQSDGALALCHWDLFPGSLEAIKIRLPPSAEVIGVWSAGQAVSFRSEIVRGGNGESSTGIVDVPLALSRLPQPLQVLFRVSGNAAKQGRYLPELIGIPSTKSWLVNYAPSESHQGKPVSGAFERAIGLAESVVESVESIESERPREECAAWLRVWLTRYQLIADSVDHEVRFTSITTEPPQNIADSPKTVPAENADSPWQELDARMAVYVKRYLPDVLNQQKMKNESPSLHRNDFFQFAVSNFVGFETKQISAMSIGNRPRSVQPVSSNDRGLRNLLMNLLTLVLMSGVLICLRPVQQYVFPIVVHPAFWLGLLGLYGFAVAPIPVAWALVLVAVALPVFPNRSNATFRENK